MKPKIVSFFAGCGGLDLGFEKAGFNIVWANEFDKDIWKTYRANHKAFLCTKSICDVDADEVPDCLGIIGGPPCQSWSEGGAKRGIKDKRGQLFYEYIRILSKKEPLFFLAENVSGMLSPRHKDALEDIKTRFRHAGKGYEVSFCKVNAADYGVPQDRERVLFVGYRRDLNITFRMPEKCEHKKTLKDAIWDLRNIAALPRKNGISSCVHELKVPNHEYMSGGFSPIYMSRNRVREWTDQSFTIQAGGRQCPMHPSAPKMHKVAADKFAFVSGKEVLYRRLSVREAARVQTFPDDFILHYENISHGYKMIGNAVPVQLAYVVAMQIKKDLSGYFMKCGR